MSLVLNPEIDVATQKECYSVTGLPNQYECYIKQVNHSPGKWMFSVDWPDEYHVSKDIYDSPDDALAGVERFLKTR